MKKKRDLTTRFVPTAVGASLHNSPVASLQSYSFMGDAALSLPSVLTLQVPFTFDRNIGERLALRDVNVKEAFTIQDSTGSYFRASLKELSAKGGKALPYERMTRSPESRIRITLACSVLARQRMIFVMQKATELGVSKIFPLLTEYSVPPEGLEHEKASAWPNQIVRAAKQCRRSTLPQLVAPMALEHFLNGEECKTADLVLALDDQEGPRASCGSNPVHIVVIIGPEGGFSEDERALLASKAHTWMLGGRVLRAETAVLVGLTAVQMTWGDFGSPSSQRLRG